MRPIVKERIVAHYKNAMRYKWMSWAYWECWHWELQQRKQSMMKERKLLSVNGSGGLTRLSAHSIPILEITPEHLLSSPNRQSDCRALSTFPTSLPHGNLFIATDDGSIEVAIQFT